MTQTQEPWAPLLEVVETGDRGSARRALEALDANDLTRALGHLELATSEKLFELLDTPLAAETLDRLPEAQAADLLERLEPQRAAEILSELGVRERADVLESVEPEEAEEILGAMSEQAAEPLRALAEYDEGSAGFLMDPEYVAFDAATRLRDVVAELQAEADTYSDYQVQYLHVTEAGRLAGVVGLRDVLFRRGDLALSEVVQRDVVTVSATLPLDELTHVFDEHHFVGMPVVDGDGALVGVVHRAAVERAIAGASESDYLKSQGIVGGEELRSQPLLWRSRKRLSWLSINIVLNVLAASVIAFYQDTLAAVIALAAFLPIISDMSGCSGNQAVAVSMRELTLGIVKPRDVGYVLARELGVAAINGVVLGVLVAGVAFLWQQNLYLSLVVGIALALNTVIAVSIGGAVPLVLRGFDLDPALASGPILTTVTDLSGFLLALGLATFWLSQITGLG